VIELSHIWRHPIKAHGAEALDKVALSVSACLPFDRHWAVAHETSKADGCTWVSCANFSRGAKAPGLMAIRATMDEASGLLTLTHPDLEPLVFDPNTQGEALVAWTRPLMPENRAQSVRVISVPGVGMTDSDFQSVSICNHASNRAVEEKLGQALDMRRWRGNLWLNGLEAWEEFELVGKRVKIGEAILHVRERITRCKATMANPDTGKVDAQTLDALSSGWNIREFGVYAVIEQGGQIAIDDVAEVL